MRLGYLARSAIVILLFSALGQVTYELIPGQMQMPVFYPGTGFAIAILYLWGLGYVPALLIANLLVIWQFTPSLVSQTGQISQIGQIDQIKMMAGVMLASVVQAVIAVVLLRRFSRQARPAQLISQTRGLVLFLTLAAGIAPLVGAILVYPFLSPGFGVGGGVAGYAFEQVVWNWWHTHALGTIAVAPAILYWSNWRRVHLTRRVAFGLAVSLLLAALATWIAFTRMPLTILLFPVLGGAAFFFGQAAVTLAIPVVVGLASYLAFYDGAFFSGLPLDGEVFHLQLFNLITSMTALIFTAAVTEQKEVEAIRARDSANQTSARRLSFTAEASRVLSLSLEYDEIIKNIARLTTSMDVCDFGIMTIWPTHEKYFFAVSHKEVEKEEFLRHICEKRKRNDTIWSALSRGKSIAFSEPGKLFDEIFFDSPESLAITRQLDAGSILFSPIMIRGELLGVVTLGKSPGNAHRYFEEAEIKFVEAMASRCAYAIENARLYQEAQAALRDRQEFFSLAAHELKTPITSIRAFAQLLNRQFEANSRVGQVDPRRLSRGLQVIDQQADRLARLLAQLLDIARIESGHLKVDRKNDVCLTSLAKRVVERFRDSSNLHAFTLNAPSNLTGYIDPVRIEHVFTHLLDHAVRYSPDGGEIQMALVEDGDRLVFSVRDWGIGVSSLSRNRDGIFDRILGAHLQGHVSGLGLGLFVSRQIVEMHGGQIQIESPDDGGTRVVVSIPSQGVIGPPV